jgi:CheY-like chemotaxis protein
MVRILVVDDQPEVARVMRRLLERAGAEVVVLEDSTALEPALDAPFDAVISDLMMPQVNGLQVLARVKARQPAARRCLMTATPHRLSAADRATLGGDVLLFDKPWDDAVVLAALGL